MNIEKQYKEIPLSAITPSPLNPRKSFEGKKFDELVKSVRKVGVIEPILVRPMGFDQPPQYEIVAGERRFRASMVIAAENSGPDHHHIPAMVQEMTDEEAFDLMTIENLQRADLTELEEAQGFKIYLDAKGKEALPDLAERIGINPHYITRRVMVLSLPSKVLKAWEKGEVKYGHLEQLCRVKDKALVLEYLERIQASDGPAWNRIESVKQLKNHIDQHAIPLKWAKFNQAAAGCLACQSNTECQARLFEETVKAAHCTNAVCFKSNQSTWLTDNWPKYGKQFGTNGFRFDADLNYDEKNGFNYSGNPGAECESCPNFVTLLKLDGKVYDNHTCVGETSCYERIIKEGKKASAPEFHDFADPSPEAPRVSWHGEFFREEFYKTHIPEAIAALPLDDLRCLQLSLISIMRSSHDSIPPFARQWLPEYAEKETLEFFQVSLDAVLQKVLSMTSEEVRQVHRDIAAAIIMQSIFGPPHRHQIAQILEIDLSKEWRITKEYLEKKTTKELLTIITQFELDKNEQVQSYLYETLGKKRNAFHTCKKAELISLFLDSGLDLQGIVPEEILKIK